MSSLRTAAFPRTAHARSHAELDAPHCCTIMHTTDLSGLVGSVQRTRASQLRKGSVLTRGTPLERFGLFGERKLTQERVVFVSLSDRGLEALHEAREHLGRHESVETLKFFEITRLLGVVQKSQQRISFEEFAAAGVQHAAERLIEIPGQHAELGLALAAG